MRKILRVITIASLFVCLLFSLSFAREIRVGIGFALPPYVMRQEGRGLEVDIVREAFAKVGHTVKFLYLPNLRIPVEFAQGNVDCIVANVAYDLEKDSGRKEYHSQPTIAYQNFAITLEENALSIESIADLDGLKVLGFNNATKYLGPEFAVMALRNPDYSELADQSLQVGMLFSGRVQVVVSDKRVFLWWKKLKENSLAAELDLSLPLAFSPVFPPASRCVFFAAPGDRDAFDEGLDELRKSGRFDAVIESYSGIGSQK